MDDEAWSVHGRERSLEKMVIGSDDSIDSTLFDSLCACQD
jgi:hypothetical protein